MRALTGLCDDREGSALNTQGFYHRNDKCCLVQNVETSPFRSSPAQGSHQSGRHVEFRVVISIGNKSY